MEPARVEQLAQRIGWFERNSHALAVLIATAGGVTGIVVLPRAFGPDWPTVHARLMAVVGGILLGFAIEVALAGALAVWELQHDRLVRDRGMPRATLRRRK